MHQMQFAIPFYPRQSCNAFFPKDVKVQKQHVGSLFFFIGTHLHHCSLLFTHAQMGGHRQLVQCILEQKKFCLVVIGQEVY